MLNDTASLFLYFSMEQLNKKFTGTRGLNDKMCVNKLLIIYSTCWCRLITNASALVRAVRCFVNVCVESRDTQRENRPAKQLNVAGNC